MVERSTASCLDSCGERGGDAAGASFSSGVASAKAGSADFTNDRNADWSKGGATVARWKNEIGLCANRFLLFDVTGVSQNQSFRVDLSGERDLAEHALAGAKNGGGDSFG